MERMFCKVGRRQGLHNMGRPYRHNFRRTSPEDCMSSRFRLAALVAAGHIVLLFAAQVVLGQSIRLSAPESPPADDSPRPAAREERAAAEPVDPPVPSVAVR